MAKAKKEKEKPQTFERQLPVKINKALKDQKSDRVIELLGEIEAQEAKKAEATQGFAAKIKEHKLEIKRLRGDIDKGTEDRPVKCITEMDYRGNAVRVIRIDTRETVESREMTADDRQEPLPTLPKGGGRRKSAKNTLPNADEEPAPEGETETAGSPDPN